MPDSSGDTTEDTATQVFADHRELLFSVVYNLLGSVADTEDVLQDTWLSWVPRNRVSSADAAEIANPRAYLVRIAVNHGLARQAAISRRRETYVGPWLPEPLVTAATNMKRPSELSASPINRFKSSVEFPCIPPTSSSRSSPWASTPSPGSPP